VNGPATGMQITKENPKTKSDDSPRAGSDRAIFLICQKLLSQKRSFLSFKYAFSDLKTRF